MHRWLNASKTKPGRVIAVLLPAVPFEVAGKLIEETHFF